MTAETDFYADTTGCLESIAKSLDGVLAVNPGFDVEVPMVDLGRRLAASVIVAALIINGNDDDDQTARRAVEMVARIEEVLP